MTQRRLGLPVGGATTEWMIGIHLNLIRRIEPASFTAIKAISPYRSPRLFESFFYDHLRAHLTSESVVDDWGRTIVYFRVGTPELRIQGGLSL